MSHLVNFYNLHNYSKPLPKNDFGFYRWSPNTPIMDYPSTFGLNVPIQVIVDGGSKLTQVLASRTSVLDLDRLVYKSDCINLKNIFQAINSPAEIIGRVAVPLKLRSKPVPTPIQKFNEGAFCLTIVNYKSSVHGFHLLKTIRALNGRGVKNINIFTNDDEGEIVSNYLKCPLFVTGDSTPVIEAIKPYFKEVTSTHILWVCELYLETATQIGRNPSIGDYFAWMEYCAQYIIYRFCLTLYPNNIQIFLPLYNYKVQAFNARSKKIHITEWFNSNLNSRTCITLSTETECVVCYDSTFCRLECSHAVCYECVFRIVGHKCPMCRSVFQL